MMNELMMSLLEKLFNARVSLNENGEICVNDSTCKTASDWIESIVALAKSKSSEIVSNCADKTQYIEDKIKKIAFLQCNKTTCWAATAVMLAKYYDSSIKDKNEQEYLESRLPSITYKKMSDQIYKLKESMINRSYGQDSNPAFEEMLYGIRRYITEKFIELENVLFRSKITAQEDDNIPNDLLEKIFYIATRMNIVDELFPQSQINHRWLQYYVEAFYNPEERIGHTTLAPGLQHDQIDDWFNNMMHCKIDKFDDVNKLYGFTPQYLAGMLSNGPVIIAMPSEIIQYTGELEDRIKQKRIDTKTYHYVLFYGMHKHKENDEILVKYVETVYFNNGYICDGKTTFKSNYITWDTLELWMESSINPLPIVIYKEITD